MPSALFGSSPSVQTTDQPTIDAGQTGITNLLATLLATGQQPAGVQSYTGQFAAPLTAGQTQTINAATGLPTGVNPAAQTTVNAALPAITNAMGYQAPQVGLAPQTAGATPNAAPAISAPSTVNANQIGTQQAFQQGVVDPLTANFLQTIVPAISGGAGRSAGGAYSSDTQKAQGLAASNLNTTLAGTGAQYLLGGEEANQQADLTAALANAQNQLSTSTANLGSALTTNTGNQNTQEDTILANLQSALGTNNLNIGSSLSGQGLDLSAIEGAPGVAAGASAPSTATAQLLSQILGIQTPAQTTAQTQVSGEYQDYLQSIQQGQVLQALMASFGTTPTSSPQTVVQPGQTSILASLLGGAAGNAGLGKAAGAALFGAV
jgi:hypothetical protein